MKRAVPPVLFGQQRQEFNHILRQQSQVPDNLSLGGLDLLAEIIKPSFPGAIHYIHYIRDIFIFIGIHRVTGIFVGVAQIGNKLKAPVKKDFLVFAWVRVGVKTRPPPLVVDNGMSPKQVKLS